MLSPNFAFKGKARFDAPAEFLTFDGGTRLVADCPRLTSHWLAFVSSINPQEVRIPVGENPLDADGNKLASSLMLVNDSAHIYSAFLSKPKKYSDERVVTSQGFLEFDEPSQEYRIASPEKLEDPDLPGNLLAFNRKNCSVKAEGKVNLGVYTGQIDIHSFGLAEHDLGLDTVRFNLLMALEFFFPDALSTYLNKSISENPNLEAADLSTDVFTRGLADWLGKDRANQFFSALSLNGRLDKLPDEMQKAMVFSELNLVWLSSEEAYVSEGPIGIASLFGSSVNRLVDGKMEFLKKRSGNEFSFFLSLGNNQWYFFSYGRNNLQVLSSDESFNAILREMKEKNRRNQVKGKPPLTLVLATDRKVKNFVRKYSLDEEPPEEE